MNAVSCENRVKVKDLFPASTDLPDYWTFLGRLVANLEQTIFEFGTIDTVICTKIAHFRVHTGNMRQKSESHPHQRPVLRRFVRGHLVFDACICSKNVLCNGLFGSVEVPLFGRRK